MGKTIKGKDKAKVKAAKAAAKVARKCKGKKCAVAVAALALAAIFAGCATSDSAQPAKSQTQNNTFDDCNFFFAGNIVYSNGCVRAEGGNLPALEMLTQTQSLESSGTETFSPTATQTPTQTTDIKPDLRYNDAAKTTAEAAKGAVDAVTNAVASEAAK